MCKVYGYVRVSTKKQDIERQVATILSRYPEAVIFSDEYTGTRMDRPNWIKLCKVLKAGDVVVFDEVSRMSRNAEEGFKAYKELYEKGINLVFVKEYLLNTSILRETQQIATIGNEIADLYITTTNQVLMILAERQIKKAFEQAEHEVNFNHIRTSEGVQRAKARYEREELLGLPHEKQNVGRPVGSKITTKKSVEMKDKILKMAKEFGGNMTDKEVIETLKLARNTYFKYKRELREEIN